ncbi:AAA-like domain-containing protein [Leptolyngbya cf. ectocarpi LEGE 11479]|uniref:AAA-like domain-containing protein n=1 Tax=Leptolyngbya cf. ectocarpi LEGE 11479 TaxID=1828722 RepID=A0A928ZTH0_LEPEC|nr:AAA-like domain-containing protein [Leptolyngbya ectocarpi]MBE9065429.1 AAA-like domain-containing protein [Leptolyngbya cf. ectocarpi LEGE 11479]
MTEPHEQVLEILEQDWIKRPLSSLEKFVFAQSWQGRNYEEIATLSGYSLDYMKQIGSLLWVDLSRAVGKSITKKNLRLVLEPLISDGFESDSLSFSSLPSSLLTASNPTANPDSLRRFPSGPLPLDSPLYIERSPIEQITYDELLRDGCLLRIKAPRRMGKSSLLKRLTWQAQQHDYHVVTLDCQEANEELLASTEIFLQWFCRYITQALRLDDQLEAVWIPDMGSKVNCKNYIETCILGVLQTPLLLSMNELNRLFEFPQLARDFLSMLRFWHEQSKDNPLWQKLRLVLVYSTDVYAPLQLKKSPLNVGTPIRLPPFTFDQIRTLSHRYGLAWPDDQLSELQSLHQMVDGHPYLASLAFYYLQRGEISLRKLLNTAPTSEGIYRSHLQEQLITLTEDPALADMFKTVVESETGVVLDAIATHKLEGMGLVHLKQGKAQPICDLYRLYFQEQLRNLQ